MDFIEVIGIDVSKSVVDACIHTSQSNERFANNRQRLSKLLQWAKRNVSGALDTLLFVFEDTGMYSYLLATELSSKGINHYVASGLDIKRSMGIARGKEDAMDAKRIALYGYRLKDEIQPSKNVSRTIGKLKALLGLRTKLVKQRAAYKTTLKEQKLIYKNSDFKTVFDVQKKMIDYLTKQIKSIQTEIQLIIKSEDELGTSLNLIASIKGIGMQMATTMIIRTNNFQKFATSRQFASYCGIAPFPYRSGTSIKGRAKVSHLANKKVKAMIHMCAISAIQHNPEMRAYYLKRTEEGKSKMSTINIIRNKLISRIFAVVRRQAPYVDTMKFAA